MLNFRCSQEDGRWIGDYVQERQLEMLKSLLYSSTPRSTESLMAQWSVSERTIKYDLSQLRRALKEHGVKLLNKKGVGYYFSPADKPTLIDAYSFSELENVEAVTQANILLYPLFVKDGADMAEIGEHLFFDVSTIKRYVSELSLDSKEVSLQLVAGKKLSLVGEELALRKFYVSLMQEELKTVQSIELKFRLQKAFPLYEAVFDSNWFAKAVEQLKVTISKHSLWISEWAFEYLALYLYVMYLRSGAGGAETFENSVASDFFKDKHLAEQFQGETAFAKDVLKQLYWGKADGEEVARLVQVMLEQNIFSEQALDAKAQARLERVIDEMLAALAFNYPGQSFDEASLKSDLTPHLKQIIRKHELGGRLTPNPLFHQVKQKYSDHYQMAQVIYHLFADEYQLDYSDNEASLLAIYLYKNSQDVEHKTYTAYLVCGTGRGFSKLLETRLGNIFPNIEVLESLSSYHLLKKSKLAKVDLIISTITLPEGDIPVVKISSFLGRQDIQAISQVLEYGTSANELALASEEIPVLAPSPTYQTTLTGQELPLLKENALTFSNILLDLYSTMVSLPDGYQINQEKLLGISIHLIIALPRYFEAEALEFNQEIVDEVIAIEKTHKALARDMNAFLNRVEQTLGHGIPYMERYALYQYILT